MPHSKFLIIHAHFYQPPRENPWLGIIERQEGASPFQNWNERITAECYKANTLSRTLDGKGRILSIVNNFKYLSFNVGPTLLNWLQECHPATYDAIVAADFESRTLNSGHGNAIAQVYNHVIMPLASKREQEIQIICGKRDFRRHYGREAESIWLAEAAINETTVELLIEHGTKFVILSPFQAYRIKKIGDDHWLDVSDGSIDSSMPYRIFSDNGHLDVFFYNKPVSTAVAFEHLLRDADRFAKKLSSALGKKDGARLMNICTDGESYGHHEAFGDMCLSAFFSGIAEKHGFRITNYGNYIEQFPPFMQVELKPGKNGEGTSWSCSHGVDRWQKDCGCSSGGNPGWNQRWREPLRKGLIKLKEELDNIYEEGVKDFFSDPWGPLVDFIEIRKNRSNRDADAFLSRYINKNLDDGEREHLLRLLESQLNSHLMFTSCAWFFDDISGIEAIQNLKYAARAVELSGRTELITILLDKLAEAKSNIGEDTGKNLYLKIIAPMMRTYDLVANQAIMESVLLEKESGRYFFYDVCVKDKERFDNYGLTLGRLELLDSFLGIRKEYLFFCVQNDEFFLQTWLGKDLSWEVRSRILEKLKHRDKNPSSLTAQEIGKEFGLRCYGLSDLLEYDRKEILAKAMVKDFGGLKERTLAYFNKNEKLIGQMIRFGLDLPSEVRLTVSFAIHHKLKFEMECLKGETNPEKFEKVMELISFSRKLKIPIDTDSEKKDILETLLGKFRKLFKDPDLNLLIEIRNITGIISTIGFKIDLAPVQNILFEYFEGPFQEFATNLKDKERDMPAYHFAGELLKLAEDCFGINVDRFRDLLIPFEEILKEE